VRFVNNKRGSYNTIINNIKLLINNCFFVRLRVNYTNENISDAYKIADEFNDTESNLKESYLLFDYHRVWQDDKIDDINIQLDYNKKYISSKNINILGNYSPDNVVSSCYADKRNSVVINYNGDIYKCTARDFTLANRAGYLSNKGELIWENNSLEKRMNSKFNNKPCLSCRLLPICNGGCTQHAIEHLNKDEYCIYFGDEAEKDKVIKSKVDDVLQYIEI